MNVTKDASSLLKSTYIYITKSPLEGKEGFGGLVSIYDTRDKPMDFLVEYAASRVEFISTQPIGSKKWEHAPNYLKRRQGLLSQGRYTLAKEKVSGGHLLLGQLSSLETFNFRQCRLATIVTLAEFLTLISLGADAILTDVSEQRTERYKKGSPNMYELLGFERKSAVHWRAKTQMDLSYELVPPLFKKLSAETKVRRIADFINKRGLKTEYLLNAAEDFAVKILNESEKLPRHDAYRTKERAHKLLNSLNFLELFFSSGKIVPTGEVDEFNNPLYVCKI